MLIQLVYREWEKKVDKREREKKMLLRNWNYLESWWIRMYWKSKLLHRILSLYVKAGFLLLSHS